MNLRDLIFRNFWLKVFSIISGTVIWLAIHYSIAHDIALEEPAQGLAFRKEDILAPVLLMAQDTNAILHAVENNSSGRSYKLSPPDVRLTVIGPPALLSGKDRDKIKVFVDLTDFHPGHPVREDVHADVPRDVYVKEINPATVIIEAAAP